jgi:hypothetical protein
VASSTNKPFGMRGSLSPFEVFRDLKDVIIHEGSIVVSVYDGLLEVGYEREEDKERALKIANDFLAAWSFRNGIKAQAAFNTWWKNHDGNNRAKSIDLVENVTVSDRRITTTQTQKGMAYIIKNQNDSYSFANDTDIVKKAEKDSTLSLVLGYFYEEVLDADRPKVGIYRIVEELADRVGGRKQLAELVGERKKYVDDIMMTVQSHRHSLSWWTKIKGIKQKISEQECIERAKKLIAAYAGSI